ncbi:hypothetical protein N9T15_01250 [Pelagibacteraceae bacterium]|nr:hypothetical protein [Pelagibacteraceae bacterium]
MKIKYILLIFLLLMGKSVLSKNFMMNCVSPDFKSMAFYKYNESKSALYVRPMKSRWANFCQDNQLDEKGVTCKFDGLVLYRSSVKDIHDITYKINFKDYTLLKIIAFKSNKNGSIQKNETKFKCRKINV